jgi:uncharacterized membrane protein YciS (DUF1049 family)
MAVLGFLVVLLGVIALCLGFDYLIMLGINFLLAGTPYHVTFLQVIVGMLLLGVIARVFQRPSSTARA